jgi:hypothetical protein
MGLDAYQLPGELIIPAVIVRLVAMGCVGKMKAGAIVRLIVLSICPFPCHL